MGKISIFLFLFVYLALTSIVANANSNTTKNSLYGYVYFGAGYDSNIYNHTAIKTTPYKDIELENNTTIVSDFYHSEIAALYYSYQVNDKFAWSSGSVLYNKRYIRNNDLPYTQISISTGPVYSTGNNTFYLPVQYQKAWFKNEGYLQKIELAPRYTHTINQHASIGIKGAVIAKRMIDKNQKDFDTNRLELSSDIMWTSQPNLSFSLQGGWYGERRVHGSRYDINFNAVYLSGTYRLPINKTLYLDTNARVDLYQYTDKHPNLPKQEDIKLRSNIVLNKKINNDTTLDVSCSYIKNSSNINLFDYDKYSLTFGVLKKF